MLLGEFASEHWLTAKKSTRAVSHHKSRHLLGCRNSRNAHEIAHIQANVLESTSLLAKDEIIRGREFRVLHANARCREPHAHQLIGARIGQRLQEYTFQNTEDYSVRPDSRCKGDEGYDREHRRSRQSS